MIDNIETGRRGKQFNKQQTIDPITGELKDILLIGSPEEFDKGFVKIFQAFTRKLIEDDELTGKAIRLLFWILDHLEYGKIEFYMDNENPANDLNVTTRTIMMWKKKLINKGIIKKIKTNLYQLNPACVAKGRAHTLLDEFRQPRLPLED